MFVDLDVNADMDAIAEEQSKRLLSLDALDTSLLPTTCPAWLEENGYCLWRKRPVFSDGKEYFEFVIKSKFDSDDDVATQDTTYTICYICNTVVPIAYVFEHVNSSKHTAYQKIAEIGLERARKYKQMMRVERMKTSLEYFCEHCVAVIHLSNRNEHEKSKTHKNYAALDKFISNFALFYANNQAAHIVDSEIPKREQEDRNDDITLLKVNTRSSENADLEHNVDIEVMPVTINDNNTHIDTVVVEDTPGPKPKSKESAVLIAAIESRIDNPKEMNNNDTKDIKYDKVRMKNHLQQYIERLKAYGTMKLSTCDPYNQDRIRIETSNGCDMIVSIFNFHGIKKVGKHLQCKLCECVIKNVVSHRERERHMKYVAQTLQDAHCIRRLRDNLSHCVLCNEVTSNSLVHIQFKQHIKKLEQALVLKRDSFEKSSTVNNNADAAINSVNTQTDASELSNSDVNKKEDTNELKNLSLSTYDTNTSTFKSASDQYYCLTCNTQIHVNNVDNHLTGAKHIANYKSVIYYLMNIDKNNVLTCKVCHTNVPYYTWAVEDHISSANHNDNYNDYLSANKVDDRKDSFFCNPCGKVLFRTSELSHIETQSHTVKLASYKLTFIQENTEGIENKHIDINSNTEKTVLQHIGGEECNKLDGRELNDVDKSVLNSQNHTNSHEKSLETQDIEVNKSDSNNSIIAPGNHEQLSCVDDQKKDVTSPLNTPLYNCEAHNEEVPNILPSINVHNESAKDKTMDELLTEVNNLLEDLLKYFNNPTEIHSHMQFTDVRNIMNCIVCNIRISTEDSDTEKHTNSLQHIRNHRALITANKIKFKKDKYVCYACSVCIKTGKELRHIETAEHEKRIELFKNGDYVLISAENKKIIDKIYTDILFITFMKGEAKPKNKTLGGFIPNNKEFTIYDITNVKNNFCDLIDDEKRVICVLCQVLVDNDEVIYRAHTNDVKHEVNYEAVMSYNQMFQIEVGLVCGFCERIINGNEFEHIASEIHCANQTNNPQKNFCFTCKVSTTDSGIKEHVTSEYHIKNIGAPSDFYCNVCNLRLTYKDTDIQRHNESFEHKRNRVLVDENKISLKNKKCVCELCEEAFSRERLEKHIDSLNHLMLLHHNIYQPTLDYCRT